MDFVAEFPTPVEWARVLLRGIDGGFSIAELEPDGGGLLIEWDGDEVLQQWLSLTDEWIDLDDATGPYVPPVDGDGTLELYRFRSDD